MKWGVCAVLACACLWACEGTTFAATPEATVETSLTTVKIRAEQQHRQTKRVAIIPLIDRTGGWLSKAGAARLMDRMDREFHIPLNETMHWVDFVNEDEAAKALDEALSSQGKKAKPEIAARDAAQTLDADLVLFLVVHQCYQHIFYGGWRWDGETYIESAASLTVYGYDRRHDRLIRVPASRFERTDYHPSYEAEELAMDALDEALREAHATDAIYPLSPDSAPAQASYIIKEGENKK
ncbi:MAG: hypothetical protein J6N99_04765 [Schwartzia sp.]|nr:hypothetical protein [Schwartzia sp. (in: firmicutes)]